MTPSRRLLFVLRRGRERKLCLTELHYHPGPDVAVFVPDENGKSQSLLVQGPSCANGIARKDPCMLSEPHSEAPGSASGIRPSFLRSISRHSKTAGWCSRLHSDGAWATDRMKVALAARAGNRVPKPSLGVTEITRRKISRRGRYVPARMRLFPWVKVQEFVRLIIHVNRFNFCCHNC